MAIPQWFALVNHSFGRLGIPHESHDPRDLVLMDIGSWWFTKYLDPAFFAYVVVIGGAGMGLALAAQIFISLWEMWIDLVKAVVGKSQHET